MSSEPTSWLLLERYALGELEAAERADVERRLTDSVADRACLAAILEDETVLPPLPTVPPTHKHPTKLWWAGAASVAAALAFALLRPSTTVPSQRMVAGVKGGTAAITLVSERTGSAPRTFREGDHFKLLATCPPALSARVSVLIFQAGQRYRPLRELNDFACGNQVPWPGAFALDGRREVDVCLAWDRNRGARATSAAELEPDAVCTRLRPE